MPVIIDQNGRREVSQLEYDTYIASISPSLQDLKQHKLTQLEEITQKYISSKIFHEIERSVRTGNLVPNWVNEFSNSVIQKNHNLRIEINSASTVNQLNDIDLNLVTE